MLAPRRSKRSGYSSIQCQMQSTCANCATWRPERPALGGCKKSRKLQGAYMPYDGGLKPHCKCRFHGEPEVEHKLINMPDTHAGILSLIHQTCQDILCSTPGANRAVAPADPSDSGMLEKAMTSAAELEGRVPGSQRMLLKAYSGIAVLR